MTDESKKNMMDIAYAHSSREARAAAAEGTLAKLNDAYTVPEELRDDYDAAPAPSMAALMPYMGKAREHRARIAEAKYHVEYNRLAKSSGAGPATPGLPRKDDVLKGPHTDEDAVMAEHAYRLDIAQQIASIKAAEADKHKRRMAAQCKSCMALDVPTQQVVIELIPKRERKAGQSVWNPREQGDVVTVPGGRVCLLCEVAIRDQYIDRITCAKVAGGRTRAELANAFLNNKR